MALDGVTLSLLCQELNRLLTGGRIDKIYQPEREEVVLQIRSQGRNYRLVLSAHPENARIHLTAEPKTNPLTPPMFCMVLRKYLENGKILGFSQPGLERVITLKVLGSDELGLQNEWHLLLEIMGKHSNLILIDPGSGIILDGIKRYSHAVSRHREVLPGRPYLAPPSQGKTNPQNLDEDSFRALLFGYPLETRIRQALLKCLDGFSPELCRELVARADLELDITVEACGDYELNRLWQALQALVEPLSGGTCQPVLVKDRSETGQVLTFSYLPLRQYQGLEQKTYESLNLALDAYYSTRRAQGRLRSQQHSLLRLIQGELDRLGKKLMLQEETISSGQAAEKYKNWGELITANLYQLEQGQTELGGDRL
ncbi:MAG TPA: NFACT family protein [Desulfobacteria bacterium]|nr:NFACT family protein [Desulfobacteria bacterium]